MPLTDAAIRAIKPRSAAFKVTDGAGLYVLAKPNGARLWQMAYRFGGKQKTLSFGQYPDITLADARDKRTAARKTLAAGIDPGVEKRIAKLTAAVSSANTFDLVGEDWIARITEDGAKPRTVGKQEWLLRLAQPAIGARPVTEITPPEIYDLLKRVEKSGRLETARRLRSTLSAVFRHAIVTARGVQDPCVPLVGATKAPKVKHHAALSEPSEIAGLMASIRGYNGNQATRGALELLSLTFVRSSELRYAARPEFDVAGAMWRIPPERMKMGAEHFVPLSRPAVAVVERLLAGLPKGCDLLFPSVRTIRRPISENTVNAALRRMGYEKADMTGHGFRRMASTRLNEMKFDKDWIERQLAHTDKDKVRGAYNAAEYLEGRITMMQAWADWLEDLEILG